MGHAAETLLPDRPFSVVPAIFLCLLTWGVSHSPALIATEPPDPNFNTDVSVGPQRGRSYNLGTPHVPGQNPTPDQIPSSSTRLKEPCWDCDFFFFFLAPFGK